MKKQVIGTLLISSLFTLGSISNVHAEDYSKSQLSDGIKMALSRNIVSLDANNNFYPNKNTTRAEFASMVARALKLPDTPDVQLKDVSKSHPYYQDIQKAYQAGIISGYGDGTFKPDKEITREEVTLMVVRYLKKTGANIPISIQTSFKDLSKSHYPDLVQYGKNTGIVSGYDDNTFRGKSHITKAESVTILMRAIEKSETTLIASANISSGNTVSNTLQDSYQNLGQFFVQTNSGKKLFSDYAGSYQYFSSLTVPAYIGLNNSLFDSNNNIVRTKGFTLVYQDGSNSSYTYLSGNTEIKIDNIMGDKLYFTISGIKLYVNKSDVNFLSVGNQKTSYYTNLNGKLYHWVFSNNSYSVYQYGNAPDFMQPNIPYRSYNGNTFVGKEANQYFDVLPLRTPSSYTGEQLDSYIKTFAPNSPLIGYGHTFVVIANKYHINPLYLLANAIHESAWGTSQIARDKNNLFGFKAVDNSAYDSAASFNSLEEGIDYCAKYISDKYLTPENWTYNGAILGNKGIGMNVKYASDPFWGQKIAGHMIRMDQFLGGKDHNKYLIGKISKGISLYAYKNNTLSYIGKLDKDRIVAEYSPTQTDEGSMIKVFSDNRNFSYLYVHSSDFKEIKTY